MSTLRAEYDTRIQDCIASSASPSRYIDHTANDYNLIKWRAYFERLNKSPEELQPVFKRLNLLSGLKDNWDTYGSPKLSVGALEKAEKWIKAFYNAALLSGFSWQNPLINANENGQIAFEWWGTDPNKITEYVAPNTIQLVCVWGENINTEMSDTPLPDDFMQWRELWNWLMSVR